VIEVEDLKKEYGPVKAVGGVSFCAQPGEIYGLLGPNGAGKSTSIGCISGLTRPDAGSVRVLGHDVVEESLASRRSLGVVPQELALYLDLSATENLRYWGAAYGLKGAALKQRVGEVLERVGLADRAKEACKKFSGGMQRRLNFACGVIQRPKVLLLDEPTVGVDPQSRVRLLDLVREEAAAGTCVLYTTHYMEEAESLCDRLAIIDHGRLIAEGTLAELHEGMGERDLLRLNGSFEPQVVRAALAKSMGAAGDFELVQLDEQLLVMAVGQASQQLPKIFSSLADCGAEVRETTLSRANLESLFIKLTGKELRE
jgi:ABC-2 type transport system ATP-binding protein